MRLNFLRNILSHWNGTCEQRLCWNINESEWSMQALNINLLRTARVKFWRFSFSKPPESWIWSGKMWPWLSFHFSRSQNRESSSSVFLCSETKRKRLLGRLYSPQADQACCCRREAGDRQKTKHTRDDGKGKKGGESEQPLKLIKNYLNLQYNINNALSK